MEGQRVPCRLASKPALHRGGEPGGGGTGTVGTAISILVPTSAYRGDPACRRRAGCGSALWVCGPVQPSPFRAGSGSQRAVLFHLPAYISDPPRNARSLTTFPHPHAAQRERSRQVCTARRCGFWSLEQHPLGTSRFCCGEGRWLSAAAPGAGPPTLWQPPLVTSPRDPPERWRKGELPREGGERQAGEPGEKKNSSQVVCLNQNGSRFCTKVYLFITLFAYKFICL